MRKLLFFRIVVFVCYYAVSCMLMYICNMCKYLLLEFSVLCVLVCLWLLIVYLTEVASRSACYVR
jgi:hypothetical protein